MVAIMADIKTKGLALRMGHFALTTFIKFRGPKALPDNLQARGDCQTQSKSYKTTRIVGWIVG